MTINGNFSTHRNTSLTIYINILAVIYFIITHDPDDYKVTKITTNEENNSHSFIEHENYKITFITCTTDSKFCRRQGSPMIKKITKLLTTPL